MRFSRCPHATLLYLTLLVTSMAMTGEVRAQEKAPVPDETAEQIVDLVQCLDRRRRIVDRRRERPNRAAAMRCRP